MTQIQCAPYSRPLTRVQDDASQFAEGASAQRRRMRAGKRSGLVALFLSLAGRQVRAKPDIR
eukprot:2047022-Alexandrium_andersonii.AAC.1